MWNTARPIRCWKPWFAQMTVDPIRAALFAISSQVGDLNNEDRAVQKVLQGVVQYYTQIRNDVAHAEWLVGWELSDTDDQVPPTAYRIKVTKHGTEGRWLPTTPEQLERQAGHLHYLDNVFRTWINECRKRQVGDLSTRPSDHLYVYSTNDAVSRAVGIRGTQPEWPPT